MIGMGKRSSWERSDLPWPKRWYSSAGAFSPHSWGIQKMCQGKNKKFSNFQSFGTMSEKAEIIACMQRIFQSQYIFFIDKSDIFLLFQNGSWGQNLNVHASEKIRENSKSWGWEGWGGWWEAIPMRIFFCEEQISSNVFHKQVMQLCKTFFRFWVGPSVADDGK